MLKINTYISNIPINGRRLPCVRLWSGLRHGDGAVTAQSRRSHGARDPLRLMTRRWQSLPRAATRDRRSTTCGFRRTSLHFILINHWLLIISKFYMFTSATISFRSYGIVLWQNLSMGFLSPVNTFEQSG